jgi:hypothetical protein
MADDEAMKHIEHAWRTLFIGIAAWIPPRW